MPIIIGCSLLLGCNSATETEVETGSAPADSASDVPADSALAAPVDPSTDQGEADDEPSSATAFPNGYELGDRLIDLPPDPSILVYVKAGVVVVDPAVGVVGHVPGAVPSGESAGPADDGDGADIADSVPSNCTVDRPLGSGQHRLFCADPDHQVSPTVEILQEDGSRTVVASLPDPPADLVEQAAGNPLFLGRFLDIWPKPGPRGQGALAQLQVECELAVAVWVDPYGGISHIDGSDWWADTWPPGSSRAIGWAADDGIVWLSQSPCGSDGIEGGVYAMTPDGNQRLLYPTDGDVIDVIMVNEP